MLAKKAWSSLPIIYGFMETFDFEAMLNTWNSIEMPPTPSKKAQSIILIEIVLQGILQIKLAPLVSSIIPDTKAVLNLKSVIPKTLKIGLNVCAIISKILLVFNIDKITLKRTTNPPIIITVFIADIILLLRTSPKFEKCTLLVLVGIFDFE